MVNVHTTFGHYFLKVTIGNGIANIEEHRIKNDTFGK